MPADELAELRTASTAAGIPVSVVIRRGVKRELAEMTQQKQQKKD